MNVMSCRLNKSTAVKLAGLSTISPHWVPHCLWSRESVVSLNNKVRELKIKEEQEIEKILRHLSQQVEEVAPLLQNNLLLIAELDLLFAKAGLAREMKATLPFMNDRGFIKIKKGRYSFISSDVVVPLSLELGNSYTSMIITGPNTGWKTVALKTIGLRTFNGDVRIVCSCRRRKPIMCI